MSTLKPTLKSLQSRRTELAISSGDRRRQISSLNSKKFWETSDDLYICVLLIIKYKTTMGIKVKRETTTSRKNVLGRKVVVNRNASGNEAVSKTRTVYSKSGGVISEKKSFKDRGSLAGKMLENKVDRKLGNSKIAMKKNEKVSQALKEYNRNPKKYDTEKVQSAKATGNGMKFARAVRREARKGTNSF
jgi:hypothetical protein